MAASKEWAEWHLTPKGWILGGYRTDSNEDRRTTCGQSTHLCLQRDHEEKHQQYSGSIRNPTGTIRQAGDPGHAK